MQQVQLLLSNPLKGTFAPSCDGPCGTDHVLAKLPHSSGDKCVCLFGHCGQCSAGDAVTKPMSMVSQGIDSLRSQEVTGQTDVTAKVHTQLRENRDCPSLLVNEA